MLQKLMVAGLLVLGVGNMAQAVDQTPAGATVSVKTLQSAVQPGGIITVEAYVSGAMNVSAYQVQLEASGGTKGTLTVESMTVDKQRQDFAFYQANSEMLDVQDKNAKWVGLVRTSGASDMVKPSYVATFTFRASADAAGSFKINVRSDSTETFILAQDGVQIPHKASVAVEVNVGAPTPVRTEGRKG